MSEKTRLLMLECICEYHFFSPLCGYARPLVGRRAAILLNRLGGLASVW